MKRLIVVLIVLSLTMGVVFAEGQQEGAAEGAAKSKAEYPSKHIEVVVPFSAGGVTDTLTRVLEKHDDGYMPNDKPLVVVNKTGGSGTTGTQYMINQDPDGYTVECSATGPVVIKPHLGYGNYSVEDFSAIINVSTAPMLFVVPKDSEIDTIQEWEEHVKENPGEWSMASGGLGNTPHVAMVKYLKAAGLHDKVKYVPYQGSSPARADFFGGHVDSFISSAQTLYQYRDKVKILLNLGTVSTSYYGDATTLEDLGYEGLETDAWFGFVGPKGMPEDRIQILHDAIKSIMDDEDAKEDFASLGIETDYKGPEEFAEFLQEEWEMYEEAIAELGL